MPGSLATSLITKLTRSNILDGQDIQEIQRLPMTVRHLGPQELIVADGSRPKECCLLGAGFAFRSKTTCEGRRQILSLHVPGEVPDLQSVHLKIMDHDLITLTSCTLGFISHEALRRLNRARPSVADALWRETLIDAAIFRQWIVNLGSRAALARLAHLLVEMDKRLQAIGLAANGTFKFPITQEQLADCLGISTVHFNRVLQELRRDGDIAVNRDSFQLLKPDHLERLAGFDATYLHLDPSQ